MIRVMSALWLRDAWRDSKYALRMLWRSPAFAALAVATLAIGIGTSTAIFSVINAVLLRPLPYPDADRLVRLVESAVTSHSSGGARLVRPGIVVPELVELRARTQTLSHVGVSLIAGRTMTGDGETVRLVGARISTTIIPMLGATPQLGRIFTPDEEHGGADAVIILSDATWRRRFSRDPRVLGRAVTLDGRAHKIVGVMPPSFAFPDPSTEFWVPFVLPTSGPALQSIYVPLARVKPDVPLDAAAAEIKTLLRGIRAGQTAGELPASSASPAGTEPLDVPRVQLVPLQAQLVARVRPALLVLAGAAGLVLLIACANVANLLLARSTARQREFAVRLALGSGRGRLIRQLLTESLTIALIGGFAGGGVAVGAVRLLRVLSTGLARSDLGAPVAVPRLEAVAIDPTALCFALVAALMIGLIVGVVPMLRDARLWRASGTTARCGEARQLESLRGGGAAATMGGFDLLHRQRGRALLIVAEIAMATMLLVSGGLLARSFANLVQVRPGYDAESVLTFIVPRPPDTAAGRQRSFAESLVERLRALPGATAAGYAGTLPMVSFQGVTALRRTPDQVPPMRPPSGPFEAPPPDFPNVQRISQDFLNVMGIPVLEGRGFDARDVAGAPRVLLINQALARSRFLGEHPIGRHVYMEDATPWEIVGVVGDVRQVALDLEPGPQVFVDLRQVPGGVTDRVYFAVRLAAGADTSGGTIPKLRETVRALDPHGTIDTIATMKQIVSHSVAKQRLYATLLALFAAIAMLLASVGVFGTVAYGVTQRTREIGVRMALGASPRAVLRLVLGQTLWLIGEGLVAGLLGAVSAAGLLSSSLFGLTPLDIPTFAAAAILFAAVATMAAWLPARRALRVDPLIALRSE
jgi:putative ABC transport system permease protein